MTHGICNLPLIPIRSEPSERSEMISQVLFGELLEVIETVDTWSRIRLLSDNYTGWCTLKMLQLLPDDVFEKYRQEKPSLTQAVLSPCFKLGDDQPQLFLPAGSRLYFLEQDSGRFPVVQSTTADVSKLEKSTWSIHPALIAQNDQQQDDDILSTASLFTNAPYLWGGKSILGIDCSGFVQVVFSIHGYSLPRDARDQEMCGEAVSDISQSEPGDLAFFANAEGKVVHVGLLMKGQSILHASGSVHIDRVDSTGIYSDSLGKYTHQLHSIKRIVSAINA